MLPLLCLVVRSLYALVDFLLALLQHFGVNRLPKLLEDLYITLSFCKKFCLIPRCYDTYIVLQRQRGHRSRGKGLVCVLRVTGQ